eukprot:3436136-Pyramimonas_sp.AAC.1
MQNARHHAFKEKSQSYALREKGGRQVLSITNKRWSTTDLEKLAKKARNSLMQCAPLEGVKNLVRLKLGD